MPETDDDYKCWTVAFFIAKSGNILDHFNLRRPGGTGYHLFGHRVAVAATSPPPHFAASQRVGLQRLILANKGYELRGQKGPSPETLRTVTGCERSEDCDNTACRLTLIGVTA